MGTPGSFLKKPGISHLLCFAVALFLGPHTSHKPGHFICRKDDLNSANKEKTIWSPRAWEGHIRMKDGRPYRLSWPRVLVQTGTQPSLFQSNPSLALLSLHPYLKDKECGSH